MGMSDMEVFETMASAVSQRGLASPEQVSIDRNALQEQLDAGGNLQATAAVQSATPAFPIFETTPNAAAAELDAMIFAGAKSPGEYKFDMPALRDGLMHLPEQELMFRQLFHSEGIPASIGSFFGSLYNRAVANPMSDADWAIAEETCNVALARAWGADAQKNLAIAQREYDRLAAREPKLNDLLSASRLGRNPDLIKTLYNLARAKGRA